MSSETSKDFLTEDERSALMSRINSTETKPEKLTRSLLHRAGYRFRKNVNDLPGTPDVVLPKYNTVIFVHGCYWHRHDCKKGRSVPTKNRGKWVAKFERNVERDQENREKLEQMGWQVLVVWECELQDSPEDVLRSLSTKLDGYVNRSGA